MDEKLKERLEKQQYYLTGEHSAVKVCTWTKKSLRNEGVCYKEKFYGIKSHRCCQMTPCFTCDMECIFCWRDMDAHTDIKMKGKIDDPVEIIDNCIKGQRKMLNGFPGFSGLNKEKFKEAQDPNQFAISLSGEPTIYPKLGEMIKELHKRKCTTFVVSNGMFPERLKKIEPPTQLYLSLDAPNEDVFKRVDRPTQKDAWEKLNKSLDILNKLRDKTRTVLRITLVKGYNDLGVEGYASLIKKANPMFVELKAYMHIGSSIYRLKVENMPRHEEVKDFSEKLAKELGWKVIDESKPSRVCLLTSKNI
jgi:tRNA wybutosine-synthesizing protein 1